MKQEVITGMTLRKQYAKLCELYAIQLDNIWNTGGWWLGEGRYETYEVADCFVSNSEVRYCVDNNIGWDAFYEWYQYNEAIHHGKLLGEPEAREIGIRHWFNGFPEDKKVSLKIRDEWEERYWNTLKEMAL